VVNFSSSARFIIFTRAKIIFLRSSYFLLWVTLFGFLEFYVYGIIDLALLSLSEFRAYHLMCILIEIKININQL
jgi:hypothetical protein